MAPEELFVRWVSEVWTVNFCLKFYTFCFYFILYLHVWIRICFGNTNPDPQSSGIRIQYGSGSTTLTVIENLFLLYLRQWSGTLAKERAVRLWFEKVVLLYEGPHLKRGILTIKISWRMQRIRTGLAGFMGTLKTGYRIPEIRRGVRSGRTGWFIFQLKTFSAGKYIFKYVRV